MWQPSCWTKEKSTSFATCYANDVEQLSKKSVSPYRQFPEKDSSPSLSSSKSCFRLMSWNVHSMTDYRGVPSAQAIFSEISQIRPDLLLLQEAWIPKASEKTIGSSSSAPHQSDWSNQTKELYAREFEKIGLVVDSQCHHQDLDKARDDVRDGIFGIMSLASRDLHNRRVHSSKVTLSFEKDHIGEERKASKIDYDFEDCILQIWNLHLDVWDNSEETRLDQMQRIFKTSREAARVENNQNQKKETVTLFCGDFNSIWRDFYSQKAWEIQTELAVSGKVDWQGQVPTLISKFFTNQNFRPIFDDSLWPLKSQSPKTAPQVSCLYGRTIDYVFCSENFANYFFVRNGFVHPTTASDHFALVFDIEKK